MPFIPLYNWTVVDTHGDKHDIYQASFVIHGDKAIGFTRQEEGNSRWDWETVAYFTGENISVRRDDSG